MRSLVISIGGAALFIAVLVFQGMASHPVLVEEHFTRLGEIAGYRSQKVEPSESELQTLPKDTLFDKRLYVAADGSWFQVSLVISGRSKSSLHRPEVCMPSQGFVMENRHRLTAGGLDWRRVDLVRRGESAGLAYTYYNQAGYHTASHILRIVRDVLDRSLLSRIDRWAMLSVNSSTVDEAKIAAFLAQLREVAK